MLRYLTMNQLLKLRSLNSILLISIHLVIFFFFLKSFHKSSHHARLMRKFYDLRSISTRFNILQRYFYLSYVQYSFHEVFNYLISKHRVLHRILSHEMQAKDWFVKFVIKILSQKQSDFQNLRSRLLMPFLCLNRFKTTCISTATFKADYFLTTQILYQRVNY